MNQPPLSRSSSDVSNPAQEQPRARTVKASTSKRFNPDPQQWSASPQDGVHRGARIPAPGASPGSHDPLTVSSDDLRPDLRRMQAQLDAVSQQMKQIVDMLPFIVSALPLRPAQPTPQQSHLSQTSSPGLAAAGDRTAVASAQQSISPSSMANTSFNTGFDGNPAIMIQPGSEAPSEAGESRSNSLQNGRVVQASAPPVAPPIVRHDSGSQASGAQSPPASSFQRHASQASRPFDTLSAHGTNHGPNMSHPDFDAQSRDTGTVDGRRTRKKWRPAVTQSELTLRVDGFGDIQRVQSWVPSTPHIGGGGVALPPGPSHRRPSRRGSATSVKLNPVPSMSVSEDNSAGKPRRVVAAPPSVSRASFVDDQAGASTQDADNADREDETTPSTSGMPTSSPARGEHAARSRGDGKVGLHEDSILVGAFDVAYILTTIACSILAISAVNPRIDILDTRPLFWISLACFIFSTVFTAVWVGLRFFIQNRKGDWDIIDELPQIRRHYLRTWFAFDLLCWLPIEWLFAGWAWEVFYAIEMKHMVRIARIVSLGSSGNPLKGTRMWYRFLSFCVAYALIIHCLASVYGAVEDRNYIDSLYWAVLTVTSVGYGDVVPETNSGKIYAIFAMICGILMISTMTAFATSVLTTKDKLHEDIDEKKSLMDAMLDYYDVPWDVRRDVIQMFPAVLEAQSESAFRNMSEAMPSFVARRVDAYARAKLLRSVPLFQNVRDTRIVLDLSQLMTRRFIPAGEFIVNVGDVGREMYFIIRGVVEVLVPAPEEPDEEIVVASLRSGEFFGEIALMEDVVRTASVQAVTLCELLVLDKDHLTDEVRDHLATLLKREISMRREKTQQTQQMRQSMAGWQAFDDADGEGDADPSSTQGGQDPDNRDALRATNSVGDTVTDGGTANEAVNPLSDVGNTSPAPGGKPPLPKTASAGDWTPSPRRQSAVDAQPTEAVRAAPVAAESTGDFSTF